MKNYLRRQKEREREREKEGGRVEKCVRNVKTAKVMIISAREMTII